MTRRKNNVLSKRAFIAELERLHGTTCINCGSAEFIEWHHVVPVKMGGTDNPRNIVPLCHICHAAVTHMKPVSKYRGKQVSSGRKMDFSEEYPDIFEDYIRCRISRSEAAERLGNKAHFAENKAFAQYLKDKGIKSVKNNVDLVVGINKVPPKVGRLVGIITYIDGSAEHMYWGYENPKTGPSKFMTEVSCS